MSSLLRVCALFVLMLLAIQAAAQAEESEHYEFYCPPYDYMVSEYEIHALGGPSFEDAVEFMSVLCILQDWRDEIVVMEEGAQRDQAEEMYHNALLWVRTLSLEAGYHWGEVMFATVPTLQDTNRFFRIVREHLSHADVVMNASDWYSQGYDVNISPEFDSVSLSAHRHDYGLGQLCRFETDPMSIDPLDCPLQWINWRPLLPDSVFTFVSYDGLGFIRGPRVQFAK